MSGERRVTSDENMRMQSAMPAQNFKDLLVWQKGRDIAKLTYNLTNAFDTLNEERRMLNALRKLLSSGYSSLATRH